jgi:hypothetical protein
MSMRLMTLVFYSMFPNVTISEGHTVKASTLKFVLLAMTDHASNEGDNMYPSLDTLSFKTNYERRTIARAIEALLQLKCKKLVGESDRRTNNYSINQDVLNNFVDWKKLKKADPNVQEGDSGSNEDDSGTAIGDSGTRNCVPESHESSIKPSIKSKENIHKPIAAKAAPLTDGQKAFLDAFNKANCFKTNAQREAILELEKQYGTAKLMEAIKWAAEAGMDMGRAVRSLQTALPNWGSKKSFRGNGNNSQGKKIFTEERNLDSSDLPIPDITDPYLISLLKEKGIQTS